MWWPSHFRNPAVGPTPGLPRGAARPWTCSCESAQLPLTSVAVPQRRWSTVRPDRSPTTSVYTCLSHLLNSRNQSRPAWTQVTGRCPIPVYSIRTSVVRRPLRNSPSQHLVPRKPTYIGLWARNGSQNCLETSKTR